MSPPHAPIRRQLRTVPRFGHGPHRGRCDPFAASSAVAVIELHTKHRGHAGLAQHGRRREVATEERRDAVTNNEMVAPSHTLEVVPTSSTRKCAPCDSLVEGAVHTQGFGRQRRANGGRKLTKPPRREDVGCRYVRSSEGPFPAIDKKCAMKGLTGKSFVEWGDRLETFRGSEGRWRIRFGADAAVARTTSQFARHISNRQSEQGTHFRALSTAIPSLMVLVGEACGAVD